MTELKRWLDDSPPDAIVHLLQSARHEQAPPRLLRHTLVALGVSSAATTATAAAFGGAASTSSVATSAGITAVVIKWGGAGLVGGTLLAGAVAGVNRLSAPDVADQPVVSRANPHVNPSPELPRPSAPEPAPALADELSLATPSSVSSAKRAPSVTLRAEATSAQEIDLLDRARARWRAGDAAAVLALLTDYERKFSPPHFTPEVLYLRMQASERAGDRSEAKRLAELIVTRYPQSPGASQAAKLLERVAQEPNGDR